MAGTLSRRSESEPEHWDRRKRRSSPAGPHPQAPPSPPASVVLPPLPLPLIALPSRTAEPSVRARSRASLVAGRGEGERREPGAGSGRRRRGSGVGRRLPRAAVGGLFRGEEPELGRLGPRRRLPALLLPPALPPLGLRAARLGSPTSLPPPGPSRPPAPTPCAALAAPALLSAPPRPPHIPLRARPSPGNPSATPSSARHPRGRQS